MQVISAKLHKTDGSIGREIMQVQCPHAGEYIPADSCHHKYCRANRGVKIVLDAEREITTWDVLCGLEDVCNAP